MAVAILSSLIFTKKRGLVQIFPESLRKLWNEWELRSMVLLSLSLQIILIRFGNQRKYNTKNWIRLTLWLAYLGADWVATVSLGILSNSQGDSKDDNSLDPSYVIMAFWAPFLLLHLGGPDTITAYSLEDNELWLRHLLGLIVQVGVAVYVFVRSLKPTELNFAAVPVFIAGIVKYGERTWVLRSASSEHFRESLLPRPDPGPNYAKFMEEYVLKESEGYELSWTRAEAPKKISGSDSSASDVIIVNVAYDFFKTYKRLFADLILSFQELEKSLSFFGGSSWEISFKVIEVELGFVYDVLYTKAAIIYSRWGALLRSISLCSTIAALAAFCIINRQGYSRIDVCITFLLLVGAVGLEIYAILVLLSSDWTMLWLNDEHKSRLVNVFCKAISCFKCITSKKKWSNSMVQYNLLSCCLRDKQTKCCGILKCACIRNVVENYEQENSSTEVSSFLKTLIFNQLLGKSKDASNFRIQKELCAHKGNRVLQKNNCLDKLGWSVEEVEFDHSILLWHIATDLCYYSDKKKDPNSVQDPNCEASKHLSDYMLYILVKRPFMLPNGIGQIRFQDTCAEARGFFQERKISEESIACEKLLQVEIRISPAEVKGDRSKSLLFDACRLAQSLQTVEMENQLNKWELISCVWVEVLSYAASKCRWNYHARQLRRGGELLTHVWLLMAHLGITEQFQISHGHARAKLIVK